MWARCGGLRKIRLEGPSKEWGTKVAQEHEHENGQVHRTQYPERPQATTLIAKPSSLRGFAYAFTIFHLLPVPLLQ